MADERHLGLLLKDAGGLPGRSPQKVGRGVTFPTALLNKEMFTILPMTETISLILQGLVVLLAVDFAAGIVHWAEDAYVRENTPWLGRWVGIPNILHHHLPRHMTRNTWWQSNKVLMIAMGIMLVIAGLLDCLTWHAWLFAIVGGNANEVHKWSHRTHRENGKIITFFQRLRLLQTAQHHAVHHTNPKDVRYCPVTNMLNPVLDTLRFWSVLEWLLACMFGLRRQPDTSIPGQGVVPEWINEIRYAR
ncbi:fatty acid desaturase CarF family protein [Prosthecobacter sp.]|uniref:fatty acid desaturase CarF family protein n=1 Tax=Prosthecobacter sp. TaxID=1965333 RepID=UPI00378478C1